MLEEPRQYVYRMMLELGGAVVERWTVQHLIDLQSTKKLPRNLLIISRPKYLLQDEFRQFLDNDIRHELMVISHIYICDYLTKKKSPPIEMYDVKNPEMWNLVEEDWMQEQLHGLRLPIWFPR